MPYLLAAALTVMLCTSTAHAAALPTSISAKASEFAVDGTALPDVDFDIGPSFAGLLPISRARNETRQLYFWYFPSSNPLAWDEITIWLNGGPGDSSLEGLLQENGPFLWQYGTYKPVPNPYTWVNLTNVVWVEQPVGTGFSQGVPSAVTEQDVADQFMGFWRNFVDTFGLHSRKVFIAGESYAGMYIPHLADGMLSAKDPRYFNLEATMMYDPLISNNAVMREIPVIPFLDHWNRLLGLNESFVQNIHLQAATCGYEGFLERHLRYPPAGPIPPPPGGVFDPQNACDVWGSIIEAATLVNPCFNIYHITDFCPMPWDVLGFPGTNQYSPPQAPDVYFDRPDVKRVIHAPNVTWAEASPIEIYATANGLSPQYNNNQFPALTGLLARVIERSKRTLIGHGGLDYILQRNGTLLALQNMTWNGHQGFSAPPSDDFVVPPHTDWQAATLAGSGVMGKTRTERGLTFFGVDGSGHMIPQYAAAASFRSLEFLLGRIPSLSSAAPFTNTSDGLAAQS